MSLNNGIAKDKTTELVRLIKKGDRKALDRLLELFIPQLNAFFRYLHVNNDIIEDLIQETFLHMLTKLESFDETKKFSTWLMTIGRNIYIDQYRRKQKGEEIIAKEGLDLSVSNPENEAIGNLSLEELLNGLSDKERFIIEMRVFQKMSFDDISEITGDNEATLRSRFFRIISRIKLEIRN